jgi:hypothetical protein
VLLIAILLLFLGTSQQAICLFATKSDCRSWYPRNR